MDIDKVIEQLQEVKKNHGRVECVVETQDFFNKTINSTIETISVVDFLGKKAVKLDWRT